MNLSSVRELKESLKSALVPEVTAHISTRAAIGMAAASLESAKEPPRTVALGISPKKNGGYLLAVRVQKRALEAGREVERITRQARGEVDVRYVGRVMKRTTPWHQARQRPLLIGCSVGHHKITAGTLGCFVTRRAGGELCILSNNHVLANENRARKGDAILQPGALDGGIKPGDVVALLTAFVRLKKTDANFVDCAIAEVAAGVDVDRVKLKGIQGRLAGVGDPVVDEGDIVRKVGRTTGLTRGRVTAFELDNVVVGFGIGDLRFDQQIEIEGADDEGFSSGGDSGSLILDSGRRGVGPLFAGSDQGGANGKGLTYANPLHSVLDALKVDLAT